MDCEGCTYNEPCPESCIDCWCTCCARRYSKDDCGLGVVGDWYHRVGDPIPDVEPDRAPS